MVLPKVYQVSTSAEAFLEVCTGFHLSETIKEKESTGNNVFIDRQRPHNSGTPGYLSHWHAPSMYRHYRTDVQHHQIYCYLL